LGIEDQTIVLEAIGDLIRRFAGGNVEILLGAVGIDWLGDVDIVPEHFGGILKTLNAGKRGRGCAVAARGKGGDGNKNGESEEGYEEEKIEEAAHEEGS